MKHLNRSALLVALALAAGSCGGDPSNPSAAPTPTETAPSDESIPGGFELPAGSGEPTLAQAPGPGTRDGVVISGVYALVSEGLAGYGTVLDVSELKSEDGQSFAATRLLVDEVLLGDVTAKEITIVAGYPEVAMRRGDVVAVIVGADSTFPGYYSFVEADTLFDRTGDGRWVSRDSKLEVSDEDLRAIFQDSRTHLAERQEAGRAKITLAPVDGAPGELQVSGYAAGETLVVHLCAVDEGFDPVSGNRFCDRSRTQQSITPDKSSFTMRFSPVDRVQVGENDYLSCAEVKCALVVHDIDFPSSVFAVYEL